MDSSSSPDREHDDSDLRARVDRLERALAEQRQALDELRSEVKRLRTGTDDETAERSQEPRGETDAPDPAAETAPAQADANDDPSSPTPEDEEPSEADALVASTPRQTAPSQSPLDASSDPESREDRVLDRLAAWAGLRSEDWLNYVGIGLLLFGLAFLFKYSVEQGWLVPTVRVGFGGALGSALLTTGLRVYDTRRRLRQVLLGGSSATFYATVFAAYQLYGLVSYPVAYASMILVTVATIGLAVQQDESSLAIIGTIGGLGTPFLLYSAAGSVGGLAAYTCTVLAGACAIFFAQGWRSLLYTTVAGGWVVFLVTAVRAGEIGERPPDVWALQVGIIGAWVLLAGTPVVRALFRQTHPDGWPGSPLPSWIDRLVGRNRPVYGLVTVSPFLALGASQLLWSPADAVWAGVAAAGAVVYAGAHLGLRRASLPRYAPVHGLVAAVLAAYGLSEVFGGSALLVAWAVEAVLLLELSRRLDAGELRVAGHGLFVVLTIVLAGRLADVSPEVGSIVRPAVLSELVVLGGITGASMLVRRRWLRWTYRGVALIGWLGWWAGELAPMTDGTTYILVVWTITAASLAAIAPRLADDDPVRIGTHLLFAPIAGLLAAQLVRADASDAALVSIPALGQMLTLGLALGAARFVRTPTLQSVYRGAVLAGWLGWWASELAPLANGQAYVSAVWGGTVAALLVGGAWTDRRSVQVGGLATLALFVGKLFFVDLAALPALWRIGLFLGFGAVFLAISSLLPSLVVVPTSRPESEGETASALASDGAEG
ncbi:MAG: DUF2339 domain-containing protein [Salinibacter sp.]